MIVGEGGCDPAYFFTKMSHSEAARYISGMARRHRQQWEQTRVMCTVMVKAMTGQTFDFPLPWDEAKPKKEVTEEELAALRALAREEEQRLNAKADV